MSLETDAKKLDRLKKALTAATWYAACETGHPPYVGPDRPTYQDAQKDATAHDVDKHGAIPTAVVLGG